MAGDSAGRRGLLLAVVASAVVASAVVSALVSAGVALALRDGQLPAAPEPMTQRVPGESVDSLPPAPGPDLRAELRRQEAEIERLRSALERVGGDEVRTMLRDPQVWRAELIRTLETVDGEQQVRIRSAIEDLTRLGNDAVPDLLAKLASGEDRDYGGGLSIGGNSVKSYPRLRTALIDALRQIGTPEAKRGILDSIGASRSWRDTRDLFLLYASTEDELMIDGISALAPDVLTKLAREGVDVAERSAPHLLESLGRWLYRHPVEGVEMPLAALVTRCLSEGSYRGSELLGVLVDRFPERAVDVSKRFVESGDEGRSRVVNALGRGEARRSKITNYHLAVFARVELDARARAHMLVHLPGTLCRRLPTLEEQRADALPLLDFLSTHVDATPTPERQIVQNKIDRLKRLIQEDE